MNFPKNLQHKLDTRRLEGSLRSLPGHTDHIDFSSNDYIGFSSSPDIYSRVEEEMRALGPKLGSTGSRLLSGNFTFHENLESQLAEFFMAEAALLFNSGYDANIGLLSAVPQRGDLIFYDAFSHASIRDGIRLSNARAYAFRHNDPDDLRNKIERTASEGEVYVVAESIYSMDGDMAPLSDLAELSHDLGFKLIVDEAHATGIYGSKGQGRVIALGLESAVFARVFTFGKAMGCHGAAVAGSERLIQYMLNFARSFIYTTAMPLHGVLAVKHALLSLESTKEREILQRNIAYFRQMISEYKLNDYFPESSSPIQIFLMDSPKRIKAMAMKFQNEKIDVKPILSPTVPKGKERIRFCVHSYNSHAEIRKVLFLLSTFV